MTLEEQSRNRLLSGLIELAKELRLEADQILTPHVRRRYLKRSETLEAGIKALRRSLYNAAVCRHGIAFDTYCGKCEEAMHAEPADTKVRRG